MISRANYVVCPICKRRFKTITGTHLRIHGLTMAQFRNLYPRIQLECGNTKEKRNKAQQVALNCPEARAKRSKISQSLWKRPSFRRKQQKIFNSFEFKKRHRQAVKKVQNLPEVKRKHSEAMQRKWEEPAYRLKQQRVQSLSGVKEKRRRVALIVMNHPKIKEKCRCAQIRPKTRAKHRYAGIKRWQDPTYQEKQRKAQNRKPNKAELELEMLLNQHFPNQFKYVGDFQFWVGNFNPDFVNVNGQKLIIELFGDYWHTIDGSQIRDQQRLTTYKQYGFRTLVIWEHELKELEKVVEKLVTFIEGSYA